MSHYVALGWPTTLYVDETGLELRDLFTSTSQMLALKACTTMPCAVPFKTSLAVEPGMTTQDPPGSIFE